MKHLLFSLFIILNFQTVLAQPTNGLVAYWPLNGNFSDAGPNAINGTNSGATATTNYAGVPNSAMAFANPSTNVQTVVQYGTHPTNANTSFSVAQDFTIVFTGYASSPYIHPGGFYDNNINGFGAAVWYWAANGYPQIQFNFMNGSAGTTNGAFPYNTWKHIACVKSGSSLLIYINGILNATGAVGSSTPSYTLAPRFGTMSFSGYSPPEYNGLNGKMDELRIYNRALTAAEVLAMSSIALPVKLSSFTASRMEDIVTLQWQTAYEQNSSHYNIQRSIDGVNFTDVAKLAASGNSNTTRTYDYNDLLPPYIKSQQTVFYRLQSVDIDGNFSYSRVVALQLDKTGMQLFVFPNPAKDVLQVQTGYSLAGNAVLMITDALGRQLYKNEIVLKQGSNSIPVNISLLGNGIYSVRLINGNESFTKQFVKE